MKGEEVTLCDLEIGSAQLEALDKLLTDQWGEIDPYSSTLAAIEIPTPVAAITANQQVVGGLVFSRHPAPDQITPTSQKDQTPAVWINALLVVPEYRGYGIAQSLVRHAMAASTQLGHTEIFVLTEYPKLYQTLGWQKLNPSEDEWVLVYRH